MPTIPGNQNQHFFPRRPQHSRSQSYQISSGPQISPLSTSDSNSNSSSPASPKAHHARQLRPMYMPAALRPNEFPSKKAKCRTDDTSSLSGSDSDCTLRRNNSSLLALPGMSVFGHRLARSSTGESSKSSLCGDFDLELFPEVTDLPTRNHWKVSSLIFDFILSLAVHLISNATRLYLVRSVLVYYPTRHNANHISNLTNVLIPSPILSLLFVTMPRANAPSTTLPADITAVDVVTSSAMRTLTLLCPSTKTPSSILAPHPHAHVATALKNTEPGTAATTARPQALLALMCLTLPPLPWSPCLAKGKSHSAAPSPLPAFLAIGTGAPFKAIPLQRFDVLGALATHTFHSLTNLHNHVQHIQTNSPPLPLAQ